MIAASESNFSSSSLRPKSWNDAGAPLYFSGSSVTNNDYMSAIAVIM